MSNRSVSKQQGYHQDRNSGHFAMYVHPSPWHGYSMENGLQKSHVDSLTSNIQDSWTENEELPMQTYVAQRDI